MNKSIKILLVTVLILGAVYYLVNRKPWGNFKSELKDFAIKDTSDITKIFLADKGGNRVLLQKDEQGWWMVDGKYKADPQKINLLKTTMHDMEIRNPLAESEFNSTIAMMATNAVKAEFYENDKLIKAIYVGSATPDHLGTFMMIEGSSTPFVMHIPGFVGYLTTRFVTVPYKWKDKEVFNYPINEIKEVRVEYPSNETESFMIENKGREALVFESLTKKPVEADRNFVTYYLNSYTHLYYEGYDEEISQENADSIRNTKPWCIITLTTNKGSVKRMQVNLKPVGKRTKMQYDEKGKDLAFDSEKYFAFIDQEKQMVYIQHYNFGRLFKTRSDFAASLRTK